MGKSVFFMIALQLVLIMLNAIFACAEIAVISTNERKMAKLAESGDKRAKRLVKLTSNSARFLATIQVAITLSGFLGSAFAAENFSEILVNAILSLGVSISAEVLDSIAVVLITVILSYFTLVFGELVPKQIAMRKAESLALGISGLISGISKIFAPLVSLLTASTNGVLRLFGIDPNAEGEKVSEEDIMMMVDEGNEDGTIDKEERERIQNVFAFDTLTVEGVIKHRTEVTMLDLADTSEEWLETIKETNYSHYPVCDGSPDSIVGVLRLKDYLWLEDRSKENIMANALTPAYFVADNGMASSLFQKMKKDKAQFAIALDAYGGVSGIVTLRSLVEELVGDLDSAEEEEPLTQ